MKKKSSTKKQCLPNRIGYISVLIDIIYAEAMQERQESREDEIEEIHDVMQGE